jgi:hypothetical protein
MNYHILGAISACLFLVGLVGIQCQIQKLAERRAAADKGAFGPESISAVISLEYFTCSYAAYYLMLVYGACLERFNHYIVWPRSVALTMVLVILLRIAQSRSNSLSRVVFAICALMFAALPPVILMGRPVLHAQQSLFQWLLVGITLLMSRGNLSQLRSLICNRKVGAVSVQMHKFYFLKDISFAAFGFIIGLEEGWPIILFALVDATFKLAIVWAATLLERSTSEKHCHVMV